MKILSRAPSRISLFGGGTDIEPYASQFGGLCINMGINLYQSYTLYTGDDIYEVSGPNIIPHLGTHEFNYKILEEFGLNDMHFAKIKSEFDGILEGGLGSSAAAAVALIGAINKFKKLNYSLQDIAEKAWDIEVNKMGLFGGKQDQFAAAFGGVNVIFFDKTTHLHGYPREYIDPLIPCLVLFYTGENRKSAKIQEGFKELKISQVEALNKIKLITQEAFEALKIGDVEHVGRLLDQSWQFKKESNEGVNSEAIDKIYQAGKRLGALGGKCCGAGGGGYFFFMVYPEKRERFIEDMKAEGFEWWDFSVDFQGLDVRILND